MFVVAAALFLYFAIDKGSDFTSKANLVTVFSDNVTLGVARVRCRPRRQEASPPGGPQQPRPPSSGSRSGSRPGRRWARSTTPSSRWSRGRPAHGLPGGGLPNIFECWEDREATFLIGGDQCTRRCDFCQIDTGKPADFDRDEPRRVAESIVTMDLNYATITGVARDDLPDGGAWLYAETVRQVHAGQRRPDRRRAADPGLQRGARAARRGLLVAPEVLAHNVETVPRIFKRIRPAFRYERSLDVITRPARRPGHQVQPDPGHGRDPRGGQPGAGDLHRAGCELITITQYLRPSPRTTRSSAGSSRKSSWSSRRRPRSSVSPASCPGRWSVPRTAPAGCTGRRWSSAAHRRLRFGRTGPGCRVAAGPFCFHLFIRV